MYKLLLVMVPFAIAGSGCASSSPQPAPSATAESTEATSTPTFQAQPASATPGNESSKEMVARNISSDSPGDIEDYESPSVEEVQPGDIPATPLPENAVVCEKVYPTGSILPTKVCRDRREMERKAEQDKKILRDIKTGSTLGGARAAGCSTPPYCN